MWTRSKHVRFSLVGLLNALVDVGVLGLLVLAAPAESPERLVLYNLAAITLANINSYAFNSLWTFGGRARRDWREAAMFVGQAGLNIGVGSLSLWLAAAWIQTHVDLSSLAATNLSKAVSMLVASAFSYALLRFVVFNRTPAW